MITLRFEGGQKLEQALGQLSTRVSNQVKRKALRAAAEPMRERMEELASPRGQSKADPVVISNARGEDSNAVAISVGPTKAFFYGFEFGTIHQPARPFARPAFDEVAPKSLEILKAELWDALWSRGIGLFESTTEDTAVESGEGSGLL